MEQRELIRRIGETLFEPDREINGATILNELEGWDSLGRLSLAAMLHESFGTLVDTQTLLKYRVVGDIIRLVHDKLTA